MPRDYNVLLDNGAFSPSTTLTAAVNKYQSFKYGWLIDYTMSTYNGHWADQRTQTPPPASMFSIANVDVREWAQRAKRAGVQYAGLSVFTEYGFLLYPSEVQYNMTRISLGAGFSPYYTDPYCIQPGNDLNIVSKFVTEMKAQDIEPVCYFGFGGNSNLVQIASGLLWDAAIDAGRKELFVQYYCKVIQEIIGKFGFKYIWVDMAATGFPAGAIQRLYNAAKSQDPTVTIIGNVIGETDFSRYPYDIQSTEEYIAYNNPSIITANTRNHGGTNYYVGQEIVGTPYDEFSQWFYYDELCPDQPVNNPFTGNPPYVKMKAATVATFQGLVNVAKTNNRPFFAAMLVDRYGKLVTDTENYLSLIDFGATKYNVVKGVPQVVVCTQSATFEEVGITAENTTIIYEVGNHNKSYIPGRTLNAISGFTEGKGYYLISKLAIDLNGYLIPPL